MKFPPGDDRVVSFKNGVW